MIGISAYGYGYESEAMGARTTSGSGFIGRRHAFGTVLGTFGARYVKDAHVQVSKEETKPRRFIDREFHEDVCLVVSVSLGRQFTCFPNRQKHSEVTEVLGLVKQ